MPSKIYSCELLGLENELVEIEADKRLSVPSFIIVGLPDTAVQEARQRAESAIKNSGFEFPRGKIVVNLAPADQRKSGPRYDLPIALSVLSLNQLFPPNAFKNTLVLGELALDGAVRPTQGVLSSVEFAKRKGFKTVIVPKENAHEATLIPGLNILPVGHLKEAVLHIQKELSTLPIQPSKNLEPNIVTTDMATIRGQGLAKRAVEIAAAGGHNVLLNGVPGAGKTLLARAMTGILPSMSMAEMLEVTKVYSICGLLPKDKPLITQRPFRAIHHTASPTSIVGGGTYLKPGEISLAHRGVLFMDEIAEFPNESLEVLRQPLEDRKIIISRARGTAIYPAQFTLVAAMNPCPCGYFEAEKETGKMCSCAAYQIQRYQKKLSGPFMDRIDLHVHIRPISYQNLHEKTGESSFEIKNRIEKAAQIQRKRYQDLSIKSNAELNNEKLQKFCPMEEKAKGLLKTAMQKIGLSARGYFKIIKLARTIADLEASEIIKSTHIAEAIQYRKK